MMQDHYSTRGKHLTYNDRLNIERWRKEGKSLNEIAKLLGKSRGCIQKEVKRGTVSIIATDHSYYRRQEYSADAGQSRYEKARSHCGAKCRLTDVMRGTIEAFLVLHYSPYVISCKLKIPERTIYYWIDSGKLSLSREEALNYPQKQKEKRERPKQVRYYGQSIDERPESINQRENDFDYEIDTVIPKRGTGGVILTLTNRKSRFELIRRIPDKSAPSVNQALRFLLNEYKMTSITADNGTEFSALTDFKELEVYYAHAYASWERGTNENHNRMIRRWFPKGCPCPSAEELAQVQEIINHYPRKMFHGKSGLEMLHTG